MFKKPATAVALDQAIMKAFLELQEHDSDSDEYAQIIAQLKKLHEMKTENSQSRRVSPDTLLTIGANLLGIVLILNFEKTSILTGKAINFVLKAR